VPRSDGTDALAAAVQLEISLSKAPYVPSDFAMLLALPIGRIAMGHSRFIRVATLATVPSPPATTTKSVAVSSAIEVRSRCRDINDAVPGLVQDASELEPTDFCISGKWVMDEGYMHIMTQKPAKSVLSQEKHTHSTRTLFEARITTLRCELEGGFGRIPLEEHPVVGWRSSCAGEVALGTGSEQDSSPPC
jgi:hypothetical protein